MEEMYRSCKDSYKKPIVIGGPDYEVINWSRVIANPHSHGPILAKIPLPKIYVHLTVSNFIGRIN